ncbi:hypothetical protein QC762_0029770 [Podospora pseudocomata]|uniref:Uncharacterized protein n=1 Tax=Podospora pseudocomata TaxID=2093779 RepID=A0ABR0GPE8_9PEZI|nr:hypothetical protein QC762_0029770 [Podospora pseudocomata]
MFCREGLSPRKSESPQPIISSRHRACIILSTAAEPLLAETSLIGSQSAEQAINFTLFRSIPPRLLLQPGGDLRSRLH